MQKVWTFVSYHFYMNVHLKHCEGDAFHLEMS